MFILNLGTVLSMVSETSSLGENVPLYGHLGPSSDSLLIGSFLQQVQNGKLLTVLVYVSLEQ